MLGPTISLTLGLAAAPRGTSVPVPPSGPILLAAVNATAHIRECYPLREPVGLEP